MTLQPQFGPGTGWLLSRGRWEHDPVDRLSIDLPCDLTAPARARHEFERRLAGVLAPTEVDGLVLIVSELVTNAVRHSGTGSHETVGLQAAVSEDLVRIEVCDQGPGFRPGALQPRSFVEGGGGLGLVLLARLSLRWGVSTDHGTCVWAEFARAAAGEVAA